MQPLVLRIDAFVHRRRRLVLGVWLVALVAALPLAARQSDNLTGGGFGVLGSQSDRVEKALANDFDRTQAARRGVVIVPGVGTGRPAMRASLERLGRAADRANHVALTAPARRAALAQIDHAGPRPVVVGLTVDVPETRAPDVATDLRDGPGLDTQTGAVWLHLLGQGALWAGLQDVTKADLGSAEATGLPIVALILLAVFGSLVAAALPLGLGAISVTITGALIYLLSRRARDVGLRSSASCSSRRRWSCSAGGTGGSRRRRGASCPPRPRGGRRVTRSATSADTRPR